MSKASVSEESHHTKQAAGCMEESYSSKHIQVLLDAVI